MRPEVMRFAYDMEKKLNRRMAAKEGWHRTSHKVLLGRLIEEVEELIEALQRCYNTETFVPGLRKDFEDVMDECTDVANFAMMLFDKAGREAV